jgi:hypothetical protein
MDISTSHRTASDIFRLILDAGPLTLYSASAKSSIPLGTIHRHFKEMEQSGKIKVYTDKHKGRQKKPYGPTVHGFVFFYGLDKIINSKLENYFLLWIDHKEFLEDLQGQGFDVDKIIKQPKTSTALFRKYVHYFAGVENQLELLKNGTASIPQEVLHFIGEALLSMKPEYMKIWQELYKNMPGIKNNVDTYLENTMDLYKQLKRS